MEIFTHPSARGPQELLQINTWVMLTADSDWCWLTLIDSDWCWLMLIDADWCWLMLIDADWCWLTLINADWRSNKVQPGSERTSGVSVINFKYSTVLGSYLNIFTFAKVHIISKHSCEIWNSFLPLPSLVINYHIVRPKARWQQRRNRSKLRRRLSCARGGRATRSASGKRCRGTCWPRRDISWTNLWCHLVKATIPSDIQAANAMKNLWLITKIKFGYSMYLSSTCEIPELYLSDTWEIPEKFLSNTWVFHEISYCVSWYPFSFFCNEMFQNKLKAKRVLVHTCKLQTSCK